MKKWYVGALAALFFSTNALAHAILAFPPPRPGSNPGNQSGPCGGTVSTTSTQVQIGATFILQYTGTIEHHGNFQFYLVPGTVTTGGGLPNGLPSPVPTPTLLYATPQSYAGNVLPHAYTAAVTIPSTLAPGPYTLQMFQVNTDPVSGSPVYPVNAGGQPLAGIVYYFNCADVTLTTTAPSPTPSTTPTPTPTNACTVNPPATPTFTNVNNLIIQPYCIGCHAVATTTNQNTQFSDYAGVFAVVNVAVPTQSLIYELTEEGPAGGGMPESGTALSPALEALLLQWIQAGAPNN
jgi:hypothetical protein